MFIEPSRVDAHHGPAMDDRRPSAAPAADSRPTIAVIAHDGRKADLVAFATYNRDTLAGFRLVATATTGRLLREKVGLEVTTVLSGPMGGDAQIAAQVVSGDIAAVLFFVDPLSAHPHDPDIRTILRVCNVHDVPIATNLASANLFLTSPLLLQRAEAPSTPQPPPTAEPSPREGRSRTSATSHPLPV
jgi:methylglyoxal synthase